MSSDNFLFTGEIYENEFRLKKRLPRPVPFGPVFYGKLSNDKKVIYLKSKPNSFGYIFLSVPAFILISMTLGSGKILNLILGLAALFFGGLMLLLGSYWIDNLSTPSFIERIKQVANA